MKNFKKLFKLVFFAVFSFAISFSLSSCDKDDNGTGNGGNGGGSTDKVLIIENGALKITPGESVSYSALIIDIEGNITVPTDVSWSTSDSNIATISGSGVVSTSGQGMVTVSASVTIGGSTLTAEAPLGVYPPSMFAVAPSAIIYEVGGSIQLEAIHLSTSGAVEPTCTFESSDPSIASVNSSGLVTFNKAGSCYITVTATSLDGNPTNFVPVTVIAPFEVPLPVTRVVITPPARDLFKDETVQLTATAYNSGGDVVTGKETTWTSNNVNIASVNSSGLVTPVSPGETYIYASVDGIIGQASIIVNPDTLVYVEPFFATIPQGGTQQFTATAYNLSRNSAVEIPGINFGWEIPTYGMAILDIATVDDNGLVTMKSDAMAGLTTIVIAYDKNNQHVGGGATIMAAVASECDCGDNHPDVSYIEVNATNVSLDMMMDNNFQIEATAYDDFDQPVDVSLVYCSSSVTVASVDFDGLIVAAGEGDAVITVCVGDVSVEINVSVSLGF